MLFSKYLDYSVKLNFILSYFDNLLLHKNVFLTLIWVNWFAHKLLSWLLFIMPTRSKTTHIVDKGIHGAITLNTNCTSIVTFIFRNNIITLYKAIQIWTQIHLFFFHNASRKIYCIQCPSKMSHYMGNIFIYFCFHGEINYGNNFACPRKNKNTKIIGHLIFAICRYVFDWWS